MEHPVVVIMIVHIHVKEDVWVVREPAVEVAVLVVTIPVKELVTDHVVELQNTFLLMNLLINIKHAKNQCN